MSLIRKEKLMQWGTNGKEQIFCHELLRRPVTCATIISTIKMNTNYIPFLAIVNLVILFKINIYALSLLGARFTI